MRSYIEERTGEPWSPVAGNSLEHRSKKSERKVAQKAEKRLRQRQG